MGVEIERKFLVRAEYKHLAVSSTRIRQAYIASGGGRTVRVRIRDERAYLTIKGPGNHAGTARYEFEIEIPLNDAIDLMRIAEPGVIDKRRYLVPYKGHTFEVDEFYGENEGLTMAAVELSQEGEQVELPDFIGEEVTADARYYNSHMRVYPYRLWRGDAGVAGGIG